LRVVSYFQATVTPNFGPKAISLWLRFGVCERQMLKRVQHDASLMRWSPLN